MRHLRPMFSVGRRTLSWILGLFRSHMLKSWVPHETFLYNYNNLIIVCVDLTTHALVTVSILMPKKRLFSSDKSEQKHKRIKWRKLTEPLKHVNSGGVWVPTCIRQRLLCTPPLQSGLFCDSNNWGGINWEITTSSKVFLCVKQLNLTQNGRLCRGAIKCWPLTFAVFGLWLLEKAADSVWRYSEGDPCCHFQSVDAYHLTILKIKKYTHATTKSS